MLAEGTCRSNNLSFKKQKSQSVVRNISSCNPQGLENTDRVITSKFGNGIGRMNTVFVNAQNTPLGNRRDKNTLKSKISRELPKINTQIEVVQNNILPENMNHTISDFSNYNGAEHNEDRFMTPDQSAE